MTRTLECGHSVNMKCSDDVLMYSAPLYKCTAKVHVNVCADKSHVNLIESHAQAQAKCQVLVDVTICGNESHKVKMACHAQAGAKCCALVDVSSCGKEAHKIQIECHAQAEYKPKPEQCMFDVKLRCTNQSQHQFTAKCSEKVTAKCPLRCGLMMKCGHECTGDC